MPHLVRHPPPYQRHRFISELSGNQRLGLEGFGPLRDVVFVLVGALATPREVLLVLADHDHGDELMDVLLVDCHRPLPNLSSLFGLAGTLNNQLLGLLGPFAEGTLLVAVLRLHSRLLFLYLLRLLGHTEHLQLRPESVVFLPHGADHFHLLLQHGLVGCHQLLDAEAGGAELMGGGLHFRQTYNNMPLIGSMQLTSILPTLIDHDLISGGKRKLEVLPVSRSQMNYQTAMMDLMAKLIQETRQNNNLLRDMMGQDRQEVTTSQGTREMARSQQRMRKTGASGSLFKPNLLDGISRQPSRMHIRHNHKQDSIEEGEAFYSTPQKEVQHQQAGPSFVVSSSKVQREDERVTQLMDGFQKAMQEMARTNQRLLKQMQVLTSSPRKERSKEEEYIYSHTRELLQVLNRPDKDKKTYQSYGIISEIMPFSDKRQIKVRFKIAELVDIKNLPQKGRELMNPTSEWIGMVLRATASICWNMLLSGQLSFPQVKILFTENVIFNFIELMNDIDFLVSEPVRNQLTQHINQVSVDMLEYLCRQYPQTKVEAPNLALKKAIPLIQNQGHVECDMVTMVTRSGVLTSSGEKSMFQFRFREDKDYSSEIMKTINYMIDQTEKQYPTFEAIMTNVFEKIYLPKDKRDHVKPGQPISSAPDSEYRDKVKSYSSYVIGRKIPKNTPRYSDNEIQYGVFFVRSSSLLRIITKWFEELWQLVNMSEEQLRLRTTELKDHWGYPLNMSMRGKRLLFRRLKEVFPKIESKVRAIQEECWKMELLLSGREYTTESEQGHLSADQVLVGKYCSNLKNAVSSYVCSQLSKLMYYLLLLPREIDENRIDSNDEDFKEQARKHFDSINLVSLRIFDLLRCKCHSNEEQIIWIVQALKQLEKDDPKFTLVRVKDRLEKGTRDVLINAQYGGGLVWEIQLAVTSHSDHKQDLLDKYNHFLYQLKRTKLGPISECVSIWSNLEQRAIYFEEMRQLPKVRQDRQKIMHKEGARCEGIGDFSDFKRPIICDACEVFFAIPSTSLHNCRCEKCKITYCGECYYKFLTPSERKEFMFRNFEQKNLLNKRARAELQEYSDFSEPLPEEGLFIKKYFLNKELSYFRIVRIEDKDTTAERVKVGMVQVVLRKGSLKIRRITNQELWVRLTDGKLYLQTKSKQLSNLWIYHWPNSKSQSVQLVQLCKQLNDRQSALKYLNVLCEPNYMSELKRLVKVSERGKLAQYLNELPNKQDYSVLVMRFGKLVVLLCIECRNQKLDKLLIRQVNIDQIRRLFKKKVTIANFENFQITDELQMFMSIKKESVVSYLERMTKVYLADNWIVSIQNCKAMVNLETLSIAKNCIKSLKGIENLTKLTYAKFDENEIISIVELSNLVKLAYVSGNDNKICSLEGLEKLQELRSLSICNNNVSDLSLLSGLKLQKVYIKNNPISSIEALQGHQLTHFYCGSTNVSADSLGRLKHLLALQELSFKSMKLAKIPDIFGLMHNLRELKLAKNQISRIEHLDSLVSLTRLDLNQNQIASMAGLETLSNLEELKLRDNNITVIERIQNYIDTIHFLDLRDNKLDDISEYLHNEERVTNLRLKFSEDIITERVKAQLLTHAFEAGGKSQNDD